MSLYDYGNVLFLDVESTGTDTSNDQIVELACLLVATNGVYSQTWRVKPTHAPMSPGAQAAHGISLEELQHEAPFDQIKERLLSRYLRRADVIVGYNVDFDLQLIKAEMARCCVPLVFVVPPVIVDVFKLWKVLEPRNLEAAYKKYVDENGFQGAHSAMGDTRAAKAVLEGMIVHFDLGKLAPDQLAAKADPERASKFGGTEHIRWDKGGLVFAFGKHCGRGITDVPRDYIQWILDQGSPRYSPQGRLIQPEPGRGFPPHVVALCKRALELWSVQDVKEELIAWARGYEGRTGP